MTRVILAFAVPAALALAACQPPAKDAPAAPPAPTAPSPPSAPQAPAAPSKPEIPAGFRGEWNADLKACGSGRSDSRLFVSPDQVFFYESIGEVKSVVVTGHTLEVSMEMAGEGERWDSTHRFRLSDDGKTLTDITEGEGFARQRCP